MYLGCIAFNSINKYALEYPTCQAIDTHLFVANQSSINKGSELCSFVSFMFLVLWHQLQRMSETFIR